MNLVNFPAGQRGLIFRDNIVFTKSYEGLIFISGNVWTP